MLPMDAATSLNAAIDCCQTILHCQQLLLDHNVEEYCTIAAAADVLLCGVDSCLLSVCLWVHTLLQAKVFLNP